MAKKSKKTKERASTSRERRLALALRAVLDALQPQDGETVEIKTEGTIEAMQAAVTTLNDLGYESLVGIPKRVAALNAELKTATESQDWAKVASLGAELVKAQAGKSTPAPKSTAPSAKKKSSRKGGAGDSTQNSGTDGEDATGAGE